jgi:putative flippase GtrA
MTAELANGRRRTMMPLSRFVRWCKFNLVGGIGIGIQLSALFFLRSVLHFDYLVSTAIAVEAAVVHNFVWHEQFTWADRLKMLPDRPLSTVSGPKASGIGPSMIRRFLRFNLTAGVVSMVGNLALMKALVGLGHMHYLAANAVAIVLCSTANFLVSDQWVFGD